MAAPSSPPPPDHTADLRRVWREMGSRTIIQHEVREIGEKLIDFDGKETKLHKCIYKVGPIESSGLFKRGNPSAVTLVSSYTFLSSLRHPTAVLVENYFDRECIVISNVNGSFIKWLGITPRTKLFTDTGAILPLLRDMIIELVSLVETVLANKKYPVGLAMKDLYIKLLGDGTPKLQVLIPEAKDAARAHHHETWDHVRKIVQGCFDFYKLAPSDVTANFCSYIGKTSAQLLKDYPDQWDNITKSTFLMESFAHANEVAAKINRSDLEWPRTIPDRDVLPLMVKIVRHSEEKKITTYNEMFPYDYMKLCRNTYKHFHELPPEIQAELGGDTDAVIRKIEEWSPRIWAILYEAVSC